MPDTETSSRSRGIAASLLNLGAVALAPDDPFTWSSGLRSPIYCDNRLTLADPAVRSRIAGGFAALVDQHDLRPDLIAGTATAGIAHAAWLAERLRLPMAYVRSRAKAHGKSRRIEGRVAAGQRVVVVEDLISTGGSSIAAVDALREAGANVVAVLAIFTYELDAARHAFEETDVPVYTLTGFEALIDVAADEGYLDPAALATLATWRRDPQAWSESVPD